MIRFRCQQCGHRIAVPSRHLRRLAVCPDCGATTHPVARQITKPATASATAAPQPVTSCANCGKALGKLQQLHLWNNHIVCTPCYRALSSEAATLRAPAAATTVAVTRRADVPDPPPGLDPAALHVIARPFRGGLFGALVGLCVTGAAMYGALSMLKDVAGLVTGLAFGALGLIALCLVIRGVLSGRTLDPVQPPPRRTVVATTVRSAGQRK